MTDYHSKPLLSVRVSKEARDWAFGEAERREQGRGDFIEALISAERERVNHVANHTPPAPAPVAVPEQSPQQARRHAGNCKCWTCKPPKEGKR
jgi:hypothetical protein